MKTRLKGVLEMRLIDVISGKARAERLSMTCDQCDFFFQECIGEVDPDFPEGYAICQVLWDSCKSDCEGESTLTAELAQQAIEASKVKARD
jgi:hypothetical protein